VMKEPNQIQRKREDVHITAADLLDFATGPISEAGLRTNVSVGIQYIEAWLGGLGCVPINNLMEDAATAEISRAQIWQWIRRSEAKLTDGRKITVELFQQIMAEELEKIKASLGGEQYAARHFEQASALFDKLTTNDQFTEFLTLPGYQYLD